MRKTAILLGVSLVASSSLSVAWGAENRLHKSLSAPELLQTGPVERERNNLAQQGQSERIEARSGVGSKIRYTNNEYLMLYEAFADQLEDDHWTLLYSSHPFIRINARAAYQDAERQASTLKQNGKYESAAKEIIGLLQDKIDTQGNLTIDSALRNSIQNELQKRIGTEFSSQATEEWLAKSIRRFSLHKRYRSDHLTLEQEQELEELEHGPNSPQLTIVAAPLPAFADKPHEQGDVMLADKFRNLVELQRRVAAQERPADADKAEMYRQANAVQADVEQLTDELRERVRQKLGDKNQLEERLQSIEAQIQDIKNFQQDILAQHEELARDGKHAELLQRLQGEREAHAATDQGALFGLSKPLQPQQPTDAEPPRKDREIEERKEDESDEFNFIDF